VDILLCHSYFLTLDPLEQKVMKPYPPLGLMYISSFLKSRGLVVGFCDTTFSDYGAVAQRIENEQPFAVGIYTNLMTRKHVLAIMETAKAAELPLSGFQPKISELLRTSWTAIISFR